MAVEVMTWVWKHSRSKGTDRLVLLAVADNAWDDGSNAWPSVATLQRKTGLSERTVQSCLRRLETLGELVRDPDRGHHQTHLYRVVMAAAKGGGAESAPPQNLHPGGADLAPEPSLTRPKISPPSPPQSGQLALVGGTSNPGEGKTDDDLDKIVQNIIKSRLHVGAPTRGWTAEAIADARDDAIAAGVRRADADDVLRALASDPEAKSPASVRHSTLRARAKAKLKADRDRAERDAERDKNRRMIEASGVRCPDEHGYDGDISRCGLCKNAARQATAS